MTLTDIKWTYDITFCRKKGGMDTLALEYSKIVKKQKLSTTQAQTSLDSLINQITSSPSTPIQLLIKQSNTVTTQLSGK